jgi:hypothetical protein
MKSFGMHDVLRSARPVLLIGVVLGLVAVSGCDNDALEPLPSMPEEVIPPAPPPSREDEGSNSADAGAPESQEAGVVPNTPPEILESWQSVFSTPEGGSVTLRVQARPPPRGTLSFSWLGQTGTLGTPSTTATSSEIVWTAPACGVGVSTHTLQLSLQHSSGLSSSKSFEISVTCHKWVSTRDNMVIARYDHTASLLPSGKVLVVGLPTGTRDNSVEEYNPADGSWSPVPDMERARRGHTANVLPSGKVLVAGGYNNIEGIVPFAELYDPAAPSSRSWTPTDAMNVLRTAHTATLLPSGKVLVAGGLGVGGALRTAELYDPASQTWSLTNGMDEGRYGHTATLLPSGKVLVVGGYGARGALAHAELYDPVSGVWTPAGSPVLTARAYHSATLLRSGQVLVAGGGSPHVELYDPTGLAGDSWSRVAPMSNARAYHTATLLPSGKVLVAGGMDAISLRSAEVYDPDSRTWSPTAPLNMARSHHVACSLPSGQVLVAGGHAGGGPLSSAELYVP